MNDFSNRFRHQDQQRFFLFFFAFIIIDLLTKRYEQFYVKVHLCSEKEKTSG